MSDVEGTDIETETRKETTTAQLAKFLRETEPIRQPATSTSKLGKLVKKFTKEQEEKPHHAGEKPKFVALAPYMLDPYAPAFLSDMSLTRESRTATNVKPKIRSVCVQVRPGPLIEQGVQVDELGEETHGQQRAQFEKISAAACSKIVSLMEQVDLLKAEIVRLKNLNHSA
jgi:hypothetical protein